MPVCGDNRPTPPPTLAPTTGPDGKMPPTTTTPSPNGKTRSASLWNPTPMFFLQTRIFAWKGLGFGLVLSLT